MDTAIKIAMMMALSGQVDCQCGPDCDCPGSTGGVCNCAEREREEEKERARLKEEKERLAREKPWGEEVEKEWWWNKETKALWIRLYNQKPESPVRYTQRITSSQTPQSYQTTYYYWVIPPAPMYYQSQPVYYQREPYNSLQYRQPVAPYPNVLPPNYSQPVSSTSRYGPVQSVSC